MTNTPTSSLPHATTTKLPPATFTTTNLPPAPTSTTTSHLPPATSSTSHLLPSTSTARACNINEHMSTSTARACNINEADLFVVPVVGEENLLIEAEIEELDDVTMNEDVEANVILQPVKINTPRPSLYLHNETPGGTTYWEPNVDEPYLPLEGKRFDTIEECVEFYSVYAENGGFEVKKSAQKKTKSGMVRSKYVMCNREGVPKEININTLDPQNNDKQVRNTRYRITGCMARIKVDLDHVSGKYEITKFVAKHNHQLLPKEYKHLTKKQRKMPQAEKMFVVRASTMRLGATKAHNLYCKMKGGTQYVHGTSEDFKNHIRDVNAFIGESDAQMLINKMENRKKFVPNFTFHYLVENSELVAMEDNHLKCVNFGSGMLLREDTEAYTWLLTSFMTAHEKQPTMVVTDQDGAMKRAIEAVLTESIPSKFMHVTYLCKKFSKKICPEIYDETDFKERFGKLVWNMFMEPLEFKGKWSKLVEDFGLQNHKWMTKMGGTISLLVQKEIYEGVWACQIQDFKKEEGCEIVKVRDIRAGAYRTLYTEEGKETVIQEKDKVVDYKVVRNPEDGSVECTCRHFLRYGFLCRHVFCVLKNCNIGVIPERYILRRWRRDLIPPALRRNTNRYGEKDEAIEKLTNEANYVVDECLFLLRKDEEQLKQFVEKLENIKKEIQVKLPNPPSQKTGDVIEDIYAIKKPNQNLVNNPQKASNKGGRRGERRKSGREIAMKAKAKRARKCGYCAEITNKHTKTTCPLNPKYIAKLARTKAAAEQERRIAASATEQEDRNTNSFVDLNGSALLDTYETNFFYNASKYKEACDPLKKLFSRYLKEQNHSSHEAVAKMRPFIPKLKWRTSNNHVDCGVFAMIHMENYVGHATKNWEFGLCEESDEQVSMLQRLRYKISTKIMLHQFNAVSSKMFDFAFTFETNNTEQARVSMIVDAIKNRNNRDPPKQVKETDTANVVVGCGKKRLINAKEKGRRKERGFICF
ncbi:FAR1-related sequence 5-like protein [Tanacetum coccineum]|uniref:FAR1-related sequence 5-like protein n=1 Tax=Tanacetum coccineum TaxID=301880 RepID=A0ABQ5DX57_9ASTR